MKEKEFIKEIDLDEINIKWEDDFFPEDKLLGKLKLPYKESKKNKRF